MPKTAGPTSPGDNLRRRPATPRRRRRPHHPSTTSELVFKGPSACHRFIVCNRPEGKPIARERWICGSLPPPLSCSEPEMRLPLGAFFFLFQRHLAEATEPWRLAPDRIAVSEQPSVSNRPNLVRPGSASRGPTFSTCSVHQIGAPSAAVLLAGVAIQRTSGRRSRAWRTQFRKRCLPALTQTSTT